MMIQEFISKSVSVLVWSTCAAACCVFAGVGVRLVGSSLLAALAGTRRRYGMLVVSVLMAVSVVCTVVAQKENGGANASPKGAKAVSKSLLVASRNAAAPAAKSPLAAPIRSPLCALSPSGPEVESLAAKPANAVENHWWRGRGAHVDGLTIPAEGWNFRTPSGFLESLLVYSYGEIQPDVETTYFPRPFPEADLSLLPEGKWGGNLSEGAECLFWHAASPSNSLILTWLNAAYGRDANCPTNLQIELFANGTYVYRYDDRTERHSVAYPFDLDGDGLENSVDPEPQAAGPDAHGTNAEWYNVVCSNVFAAVEDPQGVELAPRTVHVNTNAYYFVDVIAERGPAPIYFNSSHPGQLGSPVVVALGGETNRVPLLIGATYSVTSDVPFTVTCPTNGFAEVARRDDLNATIRWPISFTFTEVLSGTGRTYTVDVGPYNPGGSFSWGFNHGGASLQGIAPPSTGGACGCVSGNGNTVTFGCSPTCTCGGNCLAVGAFSFEYAVFAVTGGVCRCGFDDPHPEEEPHHDPQDGPSFAISFSKPVVIFEDAYRDYPGDFKPLRSTRVRLTVSAYGGTRGGRFTITPNNLEKLTSVVSGPVVVPSAMDLAAGASYHASFIYEAREVSGSAGDVEVSGEFIENETGEALRPRAALTVVGVEVLATIVPPDENYAYSHRHEFGVGETVELRQSPQSPAVLWNPVGGGSNQTAGAATRYFCPLSGCENPVRAQCGGAYYTPRLSVVEPTSVKAELLHGRTRDSVITYSAAKGQAGGIGMWMRLYVRPFSVSFVGIRIEEVPQLTYRASGYFCNPYYNGAFAHTTLAGAGNWQDVENDNSFGNDEAAFTQTIPWLTPEGKVSTNPAHAWTEGYVYIDNPFGWGAPHSHGDDPPHKMFATDTEDEIMLGADGIVGVRKLFNQVTRTTNGVIRLNGALIK